MSTESKQEHKFDIKLLEFIICPITREDLIYNQKEHRLENISRTYAYKIIDNIPILINSEAIDLNK